jgi:DNA-binding CsgD family transcriptional regulator
LQASVRLPCRQAKNCAQLSTDQGEVASLLNLSVYTVETHRAKIMQKLNLKGVPELILYAVRKGIIS